MDYLLVFGHITTLQTQKTVLRYLNLKMEWNATDCI